VLAGIKSTQGQLSGVNKLARGYPGRQRHSSAQRALGEMRVLESGGVSHEESLQAGSMAFGSSATMTMVPRHEFRVRIPGTHYSFRYGKAGCPAKKEY